MQVQIIPWTPCAAWSRSVRIPLLKNYNSPPCMVKSSFFDPGSFPASTTSATDAGSSSTWEGPSTSRSCATSGSCCCLCLCARSPFHFQGLDQGKSWSKFSASWPRWVGFPKQHLHALVDHAVWNFLCSKKNSQCWFFPNQTGEMLWLLKSVSFCPGGSGRYRAEALQELELLLSAQFGQTFVLQ